jgi:hypothetical protein
MSPSGKPAQKSIEKRPSKCQKNRQSCCRFAETAKKNIKCGGASSDEESSSLQIGKSFSRQEGLAVSFCLLALTLPKHPTCDARSDI